METVRLVVGEVARPLASWAAMVIGLTMCGLALTTWCLLVLLLTGRLPWMVRKYF